MSPVLARRSRSGGRRHGMPALMIAAIMIIVPLFVVYYSFHKRLPFTTQYTDYVVVPNSVNVRGGSPVRIAGIDVGAVQSTSPDGTGTKIAFTLSDSGLPVHTDATVTVRDRLFLEGGYYLQLSPGSPSAPVAPQGFTIQRQNTATPVQFFQLLSTFDIAARANLEGLLNTANTAFSPKPGQPQSDSGAGGFKAAIPALTPVLKDTAWISQALTGTAAGDVENFLSSTSDVTSTLARNSARLSDLVSGLNQVSSALAASDGALAKSVSGFDQTLQAAPNALSAVDRALPPLTRLARALTPTLKASPPLLSALNNTIGELLTVVAPAARQRLITALQTTLTSFPAVLKGLGSVFPATLPVTKCLQTHIVPILDATVPDGAHSTNRPVWQDFVHMLPSLSGASGNFDANGPYIRVLAGAGSNSLQVGTLGSLPGIGSLIGSSPGGSTIQGEAPKWFGDLTPADFRPDVPCSSQAVPSLASAPAAPDLRRAATSAPVNASAAQIMSDLARATGKSKAALTAAGGRIR